MDFKIGFSITIFLNNSIIVQTIYIVRHTIIEYGIKKLDS